MRCETARRRHPDPRSERHAASCAGCRSWLAVVQRARALAAQPGVPVPGGLAERALAVVGAPAEPVEAPTLVPAAVAPPRRPRAWRRVAAAAVAVVLVAGVASAWLVATARSGVALAEAARATGLASTARLTYSGDFTVTLRLPDELVEGIRGLNLPAVGGFTPRIRASIAGDGAYAGDRVELTGEIGVREPLTAGTSFSFTRVGEDAFIRAGEGAEGGWRVGVDRLPMKVLRPVAAGLGRLTAWIEDSAPRARHLGTELLDGVRTERFRLPAGDRQRGVTNRVDVWVGVEDELIRRVLVVHRRNAEVMVLTGRVDLRLFDHGADVRIEPPGDAATGDPGSVAPGRLGVHLDHVDVWVGGDLPGPPL